MKYAIMVLALVGVLARPTAAIELTGNILLEWCENPQIGCTGYVIGWREGHHIAVVKAGTAKGLSPTSALQVAATKVCIPKNVISKQLEDTLKSYLRDHPEERHEGMAWLTLYAFRKAFPCR